VPDLPVDPRLDVLPAPSERRLAVRVTPDALRHVRARHPWVFADSITSIADGGRAGDLAVVFDQRRAFAAVGLFDPASPIRIKLLHHGAPATIDESWWRAAISRALDRRAPFVLAADAAELGYRVVNGENDGLPGLIVDRYADVLVVKVYSAAWFPRLAAVVRALVEVAGEAVATTGVVLRLARTVARGDTFGLADGDVIAGRLDTDVVVFREGGLAFEADVRRGQKTGWFLDQRANRMLVGAMADGLDVLDMFAATGGFTVHAAAGGAQSVLSVDLSAPTLAATVRNMELNRTLPAVQDCAHETRVGDAFEVLSDLGRQERRFGLVVVDPPSFAQRQSNVEAALRAYSRLTRLAVRLVVPGGVLVQASCSSRVDASVFFETVERAAAGVDRPLREITRTGHDIDHPVTFPEGAYLKAGFWQVP